MTRTGKVVAGVGAAALLIGGAVALTGFAGGCGMRHPRDPAQMAAFVTNRVDDLLDDVDATPDQRTRVHAAVDRVVAAAQQAHAGNHEAHDALRAAWVADQPDAGALHALVDARADAMKGVAHQAVDAGIEIHGILTPEQRAKLTKKMDRWHR